MKPDFSKASPRPWAILNKGTFGNTIWARVREPNKQYAGDDGYRPVASYQSADDGNRTAAEEQENFDANGKLIVYAVNNIEAREATIAGLVEALHSAVAELGDAETALDRDDEWLVGKIIRSLSDDIRAALARAKKESGDA